MPGRLLGLGARVARPEVRQGERASRGRIKTACQARIPEFLIPESGMGRESWFLSSSQVSLMLLVRELNRGDDGGEDPGLRLRAPGS